MTPDLRPIEADVSLTFIEYRDRSQFIDETEAQKSIFTGQVQAQVDSYGNQIRSIDTNNIDLGDGFAGLLS
jgi:hypothetical protein